MEPEKKEYEGHILTIGKKDVDRYVYTILKLLQSHNYEKHQELIVHTIESNLFKTEQVLSLFRNLKILEEVNREKRTIEKLKDDGTSYTLETIEITLKLNPRLRH